MANGLEILDQASKRFSYSPKSIRKRKAVLNYRMAQVRLSQKCFLEAILNFIKSFFLDPSRAIKFLTGFEKS